MKAKDKMKLTANVKSIMASQQNKYNGIEKYVEQGQSTSYRVSVATDWGVKADEMKQRYFDDVVECLPAFARANKFDCLLTAVWYIAPMGDDIYHRNEQQDNMTFNVIMLDYDNNEKNPNPNLLNEKKEEFKDLQGVIYETFSSTKECPKFRVMFKMNRTIPFNTDAKTAIPKIFEGADKVASWFFLISSPKVDTIHYLKGNKFFNASIIEEVVREEKAKRESMARTQQAKAKVWQYLNIQPRYNKQTINEYLATPFPKRKGNGNSNNLLFKALFIAESMHDEEMKQQILQKAYSEGWTDKELKQKFDCIDKFIQK